MRVSTIYFKSDMEATLFTTAQPPFYKKIILLSTKH